MRRHRGHAAYRVLLVREHCFTVGASFGGINATYNPSDATATSPSYNYTFTGYLNGVYGDSYVITLGPSGSGQTNVVVAGSIQSTGGAIAGGAGGVWSQNVFVLGVDAEDGTPVVNFSGGQNTGVWGNIYAPNGTIFMGVESDEGQLAAKDIVIGDNSTVAGWFGETAPLGAFEGVQVLSGYFVPPQSATTGQLDSSTPVSVAILLQVTDPSDFDALAQAVSDPSNSQYRSYLAPDDITAGYASYTSYSLLISWAGQMGLSVTQHSDELLLDVSGTVGQLEQALYANLVTVARPDGSEAYALDRQPLVDFTAGSILWIDGTNNYFVPTVGEGSSTYHPEPGSPADYWSADLRTAYACSPSALDGKGQSVGIIAFSDHYDSDITQFVTTVGSVATEANPACALPDGGASPCLLTAANERVSPAIVQRVPFGVPPGGCTSSSQCPYGRVCLSSGDCGACSTSSPCPSGLSCNPSPDGTDATCQDFTTSSASASEITMDVEAVLDIAPGVDNIFVYQPTNAQSLSVPMPDLLAAATETDATNGILPLQLTSSWYIFKYLGPGLSFYLEKAALQGQSFDVIAGDDGGYPPGRFNFPYYSTVIGGTALAMTDGGAAWSAETSWITYSGGSSGSGGVMASPIPLYQALYAQSTPYTWGSISSGLNGASLTSRNIPDVSLLANPQDSDGVGMQIVFNGQNHNGSGTSEAAPMWAGFMALANEQSSANGNPPIGFVNPALYAIAAAAPCSSTGFPSCFHDVDAGATTGGLELDLQSTGYAEDAGLSLSFPAVGGYDLATGLGSPTCGLLEQLGTMSPTSPPTLSSDNHNCGAYGHDCLGGSCSGGQCQPLQLAALSISGEFAMASDANNIYWTDGKDVYEVAKTGASAYTTLGATSVAVGPSSRPSIAVDAANVYWASGDNDELGDGAAFAVPISGVGSAYRLFESTNEYGIQAMASDGTRLYVAEDRIYMVNIASKSSTVIDVEEDGISAS